MTPKSCRVRESSSATAASRGPHYEIVVDSTQADFSLLWVSEEEAVPVVVASIRRTLDDNPFGSFRFTAQVLGHTPHRRT